VQLQFTHAARSPSDRYSSQVRLGPSRHFGATRNLVAIEASRTSNSPHQSGAIYECAS